MLSPPHFSVFWQKSAFFCFYCTRFLPFLQEKRLFLVVCHSSDAFHCSRKKVRPSEADFFSTPAFSAAPQPCASSARSGKSPRRWQWPGPTWTTELPCWTQIRLSNRTATIRQGHINLPVFFRMCATALSLLAVEARKSNKGNPYNKLLQLLQMETGSSAALRLPPRCSGGSLRLYN